MKGGGSISYQVFRSLSIISGQILLSLVEVIVWLTWAEHAHKLGGRMKTSPC